MVNQRQFNTIDNRQQYRMPVAWFIQCLLLAVPLGAQVTLSLPQVRVPAGDSTAVVPVMLANELDEVGGLQVDLYQSSAGPTLDTILTTTRTAGWTVSPTPTSRHGLTRLLLFDPRGSNIAPGDGPVMELVYSWLPDSAYSVYVAIEVAALSVSDAVGAELLSTGRAGSLGIGVLVTLAADTISADAGDTVVVAISMANNAPLAEIGLGLIWERRWLELVAAATTTRSQALSLEVTDDDNGARLVMSVVDSGYLAIDTGYVVTLKFAISPKAPAVEIPISITADRLQLPNGWMAALTGIGPGLVRVYPGYLAPPSGLTAKSSEDSRVLLSWNAPAWTGDGLGSPTGYLLYRHRAPDFPNDSVHRTVAVATESYLDTAVVNGDTYYYRVTAMYGDSLESAYTWPVPATPEAPQVLAIGSLRAKAGERVDIPILLENARPVAGLRFKVTLEPDITLDDAEIVLGSRVPADWMVVMSRDTASRALEIAALSPRLTLIPAGSGDVLHLRAATPPGHSLEARLRLTDASLTAPDGEIYPTRVEHGRLDLAVQVAGLRIGTGAPTQPGDTGRITIFMDNPEPVQAFRLIVTGAGQALQVVAVTGAPRLPPDADVAFTAIGNGAVRIIGSSFSRTPIAAGTGGIVVVTYKVAASAPEGLLELALEEVALSDQGGRTLRQASVAGHFPVGRIKAVFTPGSGEGEPGRSATLPLNLVNQVELCRFRIDLHYDDRSLEFLSLEPGYRRLDPQAFSTSVVEPGHLRIEFAGEESLTSGAGPIGSLVFALAATVPRDTTLDVIVTQAIAHGCLNEPVFTLGQAGKVIVGAQPVHPEHFAVGMLTGMVHFIKVKAITVGGRYLDPGDELAVIDTSAKLDRPGSMDLRLMGAGVVREDGSVDITARFGIVSDGDGTEQDIDGGLVFLAWVRQSGEQSRPGADARYILGSGLWGENNGLTIIELLRLPAVERPPAAEVPKQLVLEQNEPNPFTDSTTIRFGVPGELEVRVAVYDLLGRELLALHDGLTAAGYHQVTWDGADRDGNPARSGMWFYQVRTPGRTLTRKMILLR